MTVKDIRMRIRSRIGVTYPGFRLLAPMMTLKNGKLTPDTDICIEGYPRSANSFSIRAFTSVQTRDLKIAHHTHLAGQVLGAIKMGIPTIVLIRKPLDAALSLVLREPGVGTVTALSLYLDFYAPLIGVRDRFVLAPFETVISDYGAIIREVNEKFDTDFDLYSNDRDDDVVFSSFPKFKSELVSSLPTDAKQKAKQELKEQFSAGKSGDLLDEVNTLYRQFMPSED